MGARTGGAELSNRLHQRGDNVIADCLSRLDSEIDWEINDETEHFEMHIYQLNGDNYNESLKRAQQDYPATKTAMEQLNETGTIS